MSSAVYTIKACFRVELMLRISMASSKPTNESLRIFTNPFEDNVMCIHNSKSKLGYVALCMDPVQYTKIDNGNAFVILTDPGDTAPPSARTRAGAEIQLVEVFEGFELSTTDLEGGSQLEHTQGCCVYDKHRYAYVFFNTVENPDWEILSYMFLK